MSPDEALLDALQARRGVVCLVGAGGKKTTLYRLAALHPGRVGVTATVMIPPFPRNLDAARVVAAEGELLAAVARAVQTHRRVAYAHPSDKRGRLGGVSAAELHSIHAQGGFDLTVVKADGARSRQIKAPGEHEPRIPDFSDTVIPVVSARALGQPLTDAVAHRPELITELTAAAPGEPLTAVHLARLLSHPRGALKGIPDGARVVPLINAVEGPEREAAAREAAARALERSDRFDVVVLATMQAAMPLVAIVRRQA